MLAGVDAIAANLRGLTEEEAERAISQAFVTRYALCPETVTDVLEAKKQLLRHSGMLEFVEASDNMGAVGGLENLKHWLAQRDGAWEDSAREFGLEPPHGVIILGVQGCGKSLCARAVAGEWKLPLVKFDTSAVYDKYIGETEKRIRKVFQVAEGLAPCVLWIDELEKVFAGSGPDSASADAGVSSRLLASFLSWMQDRKSPVFVAATCNNVTVLPPELIRKGRFDEMFFVDLPESGRAATDLFDSDCEAQAQSSGIRFGEDLRCSERIFRSGNRCRCPGRDCTRPIPRRNRSIRNCSWMRWRRPCRSRPPARKRSRTCANGRRREPCPHRRATRGLEAETQLWISCH